MNTRALGLAIVLIATLASKSTVAQRAAPPDTSTLRLAGTPVIGEELVPDLLAAFGRQNGFGIVQAEPIDGGQIRSLILSASRSTRQLNATIDSRSTEAGFRALREHTAEIAMATRPPTDEERVDAIAAATGDPAAVANTHVIALASVVILVHRDNPIGLLTIEQIRRLFSGNIRNWSALGGRDLPVNIYASEPDSRLSATFQALALGPEKLGPAAIVAGSGEQTANAVAADPGGIGFAGSYEIHDAKAVTIVLACGIGIEPTPFLIRTEEYPLSRRLALYTTETVSILAQYFLGFVKSDVAQPMIRGAGFVDLTLELSPRAGFVPSGGIASPDETRRRDETIIRLGRALADAHRLSATFRFEFDDMTLDARALADAVRVGAWLRAHPGRQLILVGYAGGQASFATGLARAGRSAQIVAEVLAEAGVRPSQILSAGPLNPVACEDAPAGVSRNRRVEAWIR